MKINEIIKKYPELKEKIKKLIEKEVIFIDIHDNQHNITKKYIENLIKSVDK